MKLDMYYCLEFLRQKGVCVVPGSGFGKLDGRWHFRYVTGREGGRPLLVPPPWIFPTIIKSTRCLESGLLFPKDTLTILDLILDYLL